MTTATARLKERYRREIVPALKERLGHTNDLAVPRLLKIVISMGLGAGTRDNKLIDQAEASLTALAGQKAQRTRSRKSVAAFRLREGMEVGVRVTLRGQRMFEFLDRLITLALPRVRDFRGLNPNGFDGRGNYSFGLTEQFVFPEIDPDKITQVQGMNITFVTTARTDDEGRELLRELGLPLRKD
jgi:large subunit ribosomal protein L5